MQAKKFNRIDTLVKRSPLIIAGVYLIFSFIWIVYSDSLVLRFYIDSQAITAIQTYKGWAFVLLSSVVIYLLILSSNKTILKYFKNKVRVENIFEATFEQAAVGIIHHDEQYNWMRFNEKVCDMLQYSKSELKMISLEKLVHPDDLEFGKELDQKILRGEMTSYQIEKRYRRKDESIIHVLLSKSIATDTDNKHMFFVSVLEDITYLKEIESNLKRAYQLAEIGNWKFELESKKIYLSKEVLKLHEVDANFEPSVDKILSFCKTEEDRSKLKDAIQQCFEKNELFDIEIQIVTAKGNDRWIRIVGETEWYNGKCISLYGSSQNIDHRKKAEISYQELYKSEKIQRIHTEKINQRLNILDEVGSMFVKSNPELNIIFEKTAELLVENVADICSIDLFMDEKLKRVAQKAYSEKIDKWIQTRKSEAHDTPYNLDFINEVLKTGKTTIFNDITEGLENKIKDKKQDDIYQSLQIHTVMLIPIIIKEKVNGIISLEMTTESGRKFSEEDDLFLTELANKMALFLENMWMRDNLKSFNTKLEEQVEERTKQLEAINEELESFSYSVSHDLRTPLRAISGYSNLLIEDHQEQLEGEGKEFLDIIQSEVSRMGDLIDDLLAFFRLSRTGIQLLEFDMDKLVHKCIEELYLVNSNLDVQFDVGDLKSVTGDPNLLKQVWVNLLSNAVKYRQESVHPHIKIKRVEDVENHQIIFSIQDNGVGFDMKYSDKLFGVFQRLHSDDEFEGTGIGLALVKRIINRHKGDVWAESTPGIGSVFYFSIPA